MHIIQRTHLRSAPDIRRQHDAQCSGAPRLRSGYPIACCSLHRVVACAVKGKAALAPVASRKSLKNGLLLPEGDATLAQIVGRHLNFDLVTGQDTDIVFTHATGNMGSDNVPVLQLNAKHGVRQGLKDRTLHFNMIFFRHLGPANSAKCARPRILPEGPRDR